MRVWSLAMIILMNNYQSGTNLRKAWWNRTFRELQKDAWEICLFEKDVNILNLTLSIGCWIAFHICNILILLLASGDLGTFNDPPIGAAWRERATCSWQTVWKIKLSPGKQKLLQGILFELQVSGSLCLYWSPYASLKKLRLFHHCSFLMRTQRN